MNVLAHTQLSLERAARHARRAGDEALAQAFEQDIIHLRRFADGLVLDETARI